MFFRTRTRDFSLVSPEKKYLLPRFHVLFSRQYFFIGYGLVFFLIVLLTSSPFISQATISTFYPGNCLGGWNHPEQAAGEPTLSRNAERNSFTDENAASVQNSAASLYCADFTGEIPEGAEPKTFELHLSFSVENEQNTENHPVTPWESSTTEEGVELITPTLDEVLPVEKTREVETSEDNSHEPPVDEPEETAEPPSPPEPDVPSSEPISFFEKIFSVVHAQEAAPSETTEASAPEEKGEPESIGIVEEKKLEKTVREEKSEPTLPEDVAPLSPSEPTETESSSTTPPLEDEPTEQVSGGVPETIDTDAILEVRYSIDGSTWKTLGTVDRTLWKNLSFSLPLTSWEDLSTLQLEFRTLPTIDATPHLYLDGMWIDVENEVPEPTFAAPVVSLEDSSLVISGESEYAANETPTFSISDPELSKIQLLGLIETHQAEVISDTDDVLKLGDEPDTGKENMPLIQEIRDFITPEKEEPAPIPSIPQESPILEKEVESLSPVSFRSLEDLLKPGSFHERFGKSVVHAENAPPPEVEATVTTSGGDPTDIVARVTRLTIDGEEKNQITIEKPSRHYRPGTYVLKISVHTEEVILLSEKEFTWGVLAINTSKSIYHPGDDAFLQMGVLDDQGYTICDADLDLSIVRQGKEVGTFSTNNGTIVRDESCGPNNVITVPDYYAHFPVPSETGTYTMRLSANTENGIKRITDSFQVAATTPFDIVRTGPTRINPTAWYGVTLEITGEEAFQGTIEEIVPGDFVIRVPQKSIPFTRIEKGEDVTRIIWDLTLKADEKKTLGYQFDAPDISPELYLIGPLSVKKDDQTLFSETRQWQIASDAVCTSTGTGNWNTIGTWSCGHVPVNADSVVIANGHTVTIDVNTAANNAGVTIDPGGTLTTDNNSRVLRIGGGFTNNGTFTAGNSTVLFNRDVNLTPVFTGSFTGSNKLNNFEISPAATANRTWGLGAALDIGGTFRIVPTLGSGTPSPTVNLGGTTTVTGATTVQPGAGVSVTLDAVSGSNYALTTSSLTNDGSVGNTATVTLRASTLTLTGTSGTLLSNNDVFTQGTSEVKITSASGTPTLLSAATTFHKLTINAAATVINAGAAITMSNADSANKLYIQSGVLNDGGNQIAGTANGTLQVDAGAALCIGGTAAGTNATCDSGAVPTTATTFPTNYTNGNITLSSTSTIYYNADAATTISSTPTYGNLTLRPLLVATNRTYTAGGALTVAGTLDSTPSVSGGATKSLTVNLAGTTTITSALIVEGRTGGAAGTTTFDTTGSNYALTAGTVSIASGSTLTGNGSTITTTGTSGTLFTVNGTFTQGTSTVVMNPDASVTLTSGAITFYNLDLLPTINTTARTYTFGSGALTIASGGRFKINPTAQGASSTAALTVTMGAAITVDAGSTTTVQATQVSTSTVTAILDTKSGSNYALSTGFLSLQAGGTLTAQASTITLTGTSNAANLITISSGTFTAGTSTVSITGNGSNVVNSGALTGSSALYNLTINITGVTKSLGAALTATGTTTITLGTLDTTASNYALSTGFISIASSASAILNGRGSTITLTGTSGTLFTRGASGVFTQGTSNVTLSPASGTGITFLSGATTFNRITVSSSASVINAGAAITFSNADTSNGLFITTGVFNDGGNQITGTSNGTLSVSNGATLCIGGTAAGTSATCNSGATPTTATTFPTSFTNGNISLGTTSTVSYLANDAMTISATPTYGNLSLIPVIATSGKTYTFSGSTTINGNFTIQPSSGTFLLTVNMGGSITVASGKTTTIDRSNSATSLLDTISGSNYALSTGFLVIATGGTLTAQNATLTLTGVSGTLFTRTGTFTQGGSTVSVTSASGTPTLLSAATTFHILNINAAATIINAGAAITTDNSAGNKLYIQTGVFNTEGNTITAGTSGTLQLDANTTLCRGGTTGATNATCDSGATQTSAIPSAGWTTFSLDAASTVIYLSDAAQSVDAATYGNLKLSPKLTGNQIYTLSGAIGANGNVTVSPTASSTFSLTVNLGGTITASATSTLALSPGGSATTTLDVRPSSTDYNVSTGFLTIGSNATLDASGAASTITISGTSGTLITATGTFTEGSSTVTLSGNGSATINSGSLSFYNLTSSGTGTKTMGSNYTISNTFTISAGTFSASSFSITLSGTNGTPFVNSATFSPGTGTVSYTGNNGSGNTTVAGTTYYNLTVNNSAETYVFGGGVTVDPAATLTITDGTLSTSGSNYALAAGHVVIGVNSTSILNLNASSVSFTGTSGTLLTRGTSGVLTSGTSTVTLSGNGSATINSGNLTVPNNFYNLVSSGTGTKTQGAGITVSNVFTLSNGTFACASYAFRLIGTTGNPFPTPSGTFDPGTGTVYYTGINASGDTTIRAVSYYNLILQAVGETFVLSGATTLDTAGTLTVSKGTLDTTASNYAIDAGFLNINDDSGTGMLANASTITLRGTSGTLFTLGTTGFFTGGTSTVLANPNASVSVLSGPFTGSNALYNLTLAPALSGGSKTYTLSDAAATMNGTFSIEPTATGLGQSLIVNPQGNLTVGILTAIQPDSFNTPTATLDLRPVSTDYNLTTGNIDILARATLDAGSSSSTVSVSGNWTRTGSGTFTPGSSTVLFTGSTTALVSGTTTFYNLTISNATAKEVDFATSGSPQFHVTNTFTVTGHSGQRIKLYSDSAGTKWLFHPTGTASVDYADVRDGGCVSGAITMVPTNSVDSGNNEYCWGLATLTFDISDASIGFGDLTTANARWATGDTLGSSSDTAAHTISLSTNASYGYSLIYMGDTLTSGANTIASAAITNDADGTPGTAAFGLSIDTNGGSTIATGYDHNATANQRDWSWTANTATTIASKTSAVTSTETLNAYYIANISGITPAGSYSTPITYILTANF